MSDFDNNMRGVLFKNNKDGNEKRPDYTGECEIDGEEYKISAWIKEGKSGTKFMSLSFQSKEAKYAPKTPAKLAEEDESLPF